MQLLFLVLSLAVYVEMLGATGNSLCSEGRVRAATGGSSPTTAGFVLLGLGVAGLFLARLDAVFFLAGLVLMIGWEIVAGRALWRHLGCLALGMLPPILTYLIWHYLTFDHWVTVSGAIKAGAATRSTYLWFGVLFSLFCFFWLWLSRAREMPRLLFPLICYVGGVYLYGSLVQGGLAYRVGLFYELVRLATLRNVGGVWTLGPLLLLAFLVVGWCVGRGERWLSREWYRKLTLGGARLMVGLAVAIWWLRFQPATFTAYQVRLQATQWLRRQIPKDALVAGWEVGIVGAFADRGVTNLEGLVSSWHYKETYLDKGGVSEFIDEQDIDYLCQYLLDRREIGTGNSWRYAGVELAGWHVLYSEPYTFRSMVLPWRARQDVYFVLSRRPAGPAPTLAEWMQSPDWTAH